MRGSPQRPAAVPLVQGRSMHLFLPCTSGSVASRSRQPLIGTAAFKQKKKTKRATGAHTCYGVQKFLLISLHCQVPWKEIQFFSSIGEAREKILYIWLEYLKKSKVYSLSCFALA